MGAFDAPFLGSPSVRKHKNSLFRFADVSASDGKQTKPLKQTACEECLILRTDETNSK